MTDDNDRLVEGTLPRDPRADATPLDSHLDATAGVAEASGDTAYQPFPVTTLPAPVAAFVQEASRAIGCDEAFIALPLLSALAASVGNTHRVRLKNSWSEPAILWTAIIGESGSHKSPAFESAMQPLRDWQARAFSEYRREKKTYDDALSHQATGGGGGRRGSVSSHTPGAPVAKRLLCSDTTVEALAGILRHAPRGVILCRDELSGWVASFDQYRSGSRGSDASHWLEMHRGGHLLVDRKSLEEPIAVSMASVSIAGGIQPGVLKQALGKSHLENGLAARFLMAMPPRRAIVWKDADMNDGTKAAINALFDQLLGLQLELDENQSPVPTELVLTNTAQARWVEFYNRHSRRRDHLSGELAAAFSKLEAYAARLALLFHLVEQASGAGESDPFVGINDEVVDRAVQLVDWFAGETTRIYAVLGLAATADGYNELLGIVQGRGGAITPRKLQHAARRYRRDGTAMQRDLDALVASGRGRWEEQRSESGRGRPSRVFRALDGSTMESDGVERVTEMKPTTGNVLVGSGNGNEIPPSETAWTGQVYDA